MDEVVQKKGINQAVIEFLRTRRSVPAKMLGEPGPDPQQVKEMIALASRVPDHAKLAPWRFIRYSPSYCIALGEKFLARALVRDPAMNGMQQELELERFTRAPVVVAIVSRAADHPKAPVWEQILSAGAAGMTLLCAANAYGWDAQWITEWIAYDEELGPDLGLREGERVAGFVHIGTRTQPKTERDRPEIDSIYSVMGEF